MRSAAPRVAVLLFLAMILTILGAWLPAGIIGTGAWTSIEILGKPFFGFGPPVTSIRRTSAPGMDFFSISLGYADAGTRRTAPSGDEPEFIRVLTPWMRHTGLATLRSHIAADDVPRGRILFETRGWPARAVWCEYRYGAKTVLPLEVRGAIVLTGVHRAFRSGVFGGVPRTLPYRPIWSGLAINTGFWTAVVAPLVFAPTLIRRIRRRRAGACPACGYDLIGTPGPVCPECGAGRTLTD
jgi:hypothetical protein